jgi:hypothetical protein
MSRLMIATLLGACAFTAPAVAANPPANICIELTAWIDQSNKVDGGKLADASNTPASKAPADPKMATAVEPAKGAAAAPAPGGQDQPQHSSGLSGPVRNDGPGAAGPQGVAQESARSSEANPKSKPTAQAPAPATPEPKALAPSPQALEKVRQLAGANDLDACAAVAREMRLAGVALPNPIIALAALKPELRNTASQGPAPGVPHIPSSGVVAPAPKLIPGQSAPQQPEPQAR